MSRISQGSIIVISLNLLGWGMFGFLGWQLYHTSDKIVAAYQELYTTARGGEDLLAINRIFAETMESRAVAVAAFLRGDAPIVLIEKIEGLARVAGVELELNEPEVVIGNVASLNLTFRATGSFAGLYRLMVLLENLPYRFDWRLLTLVLRGGTTWAGDFDMAIISYIPNNATN